MATTVSSGTTISGEFIGASDGPVTVLDGGSITQSTDDATTIVSSGGQVTSSTLLGGTTVEAGGQLLGDRVFSEVTLSGGFASGDTYLSGSDLFVLTGATASGEILSSGSYTEVYGGTALGPTIEAGGAMELIDGSVSGGSVLGVQGVYIGSFASDVTVGDGGVQLVVQGSTNGTVVLSSAIQELETFDSGIATVASGTVVSSGGVVVLGAYGFGNYSETVTLADAVVSSGGIVLDLDGTLSGITVEPGGLVVTSGVAVLQEPTSGGTQLLYYDEVVSVAASVLSGAAVIGTDVEYVQAGGTALDTTIALGGSAVVEGNLVSAAVINGGTVDLLSSGSAMATAVVSGGALNVSAGAVANGTFVGSGSRLYVYSGGVANGTSVSSGGADFVASEGVANGTLVGSGGAETIYAGGVASGTSVGGKESIDPGGVATGASVASGGTEYVSAGGVASGTMLANGALETLSSGATATGTVVGSGGEEQVLSGGLTTGIDILAGGMLALDGLTYSAQNSHFTFKSSTDGLTIEEGSVISTVRLAGSYANETFQLSGDSSGGTLVTVACYLSGTRILTSRGEVPVEVLAVGDTVVTASSELRPVRWIGRRSYAGRFLAANPGAQPVRFHAGSLGGGLPRRDLLVSPEHAMLLDGMLIPARCLLNGSTVTQERGLRRVDYYHVELDSHDVLLAEGAPSESYLDDDSRGMFHNAAEFAALYPDAAAAGRFCAPRVDHGPELEAIRRRLAGQIVVAA